MCRSRSKEQTYVKRVVDLVAEQRYECPLLLHQQPLLLLLEVVFSPLAVQAQGDAEQVEAPRRHHCELTAVRARALGVARRRRQHRRHLQHHQGHVRRELQRAEEGDPGVPGLQQVEE